MISIISMAEHYMIICHEDLFNTSWYNKLYNLKVNQGYSVSYIEIEDGHDVGAIQFVIEDFEPDYVLLIGDASEYPDGSKQIAMASNGNYIPFHYDLMYDPFHGPSESPIPNDEWFVENSPGVYIGRIPANSAQEVENWVDKLVDYVHGYSEYESWKSNILFTTGNMDHPSNGCRGIYRNMERDTLITRYIQGTNLAYTALNSADFSDPYGYSDDRSEAFEDAVNAGAGFINAFGVGADETFLVNFYYSGSDWNFTNAGQYPFLNGMSCYVGRIQDYNNNQNTESIIQRLMFLDDAGIVNCIAPTWGTGTYGVRKFDEIAFEKFFQSGYQNLGKALTEIKSDFIAACPRYDWMSKSIVLYGDPTAVLPVYQYKSGNITENTEWCGSIVVENDISVAAGVTLTIQPGTGIFFKSGKFLEVNGTLIAKGTASYPIVFSSASENPAMGNWPCIIFEDSSNDDYCRLEHCKIEYAYQGVTCDHASPTIVNCEFTDCNKAIYLYYSSPTIDSNTIHNNYWGIYAMNSNPAVHNNYIYSNSNAGAHFLTNCVPVFYDNTFSANNYGVYLYSNSDARFGPTSGQAHGNNVISDNTVYGLRAYYYCDPFLGSSDAYNNRIGGYNSIYGSGSYNAHAYYYSNIEAEWCWWGASPPPAKFYSSYYSSIDYTPYLGSNPGGGSSLSKTTGISGAMAENIHDYRLAGFNPKKPNRNSPTDLWLWGHDLFINDKITDAIAVYQLLVADFSDQELACRGLGAIYHWYHDLKDDGLTRYLEELIADSKIHGSVKQTAGELLVSVYLEDRNLPDAEKICEMIMDQYPDTESEKNVLFSLVLANKYAGKNPEKAMRYTELLNRNYPKDELTLLAREEMGEKVDWNLCKPISEPDEPAVELLPDKFALHSNYPNPFNPTTVIGYDLPEEAQVTLVIYDISGREVTRLVNSKKPAGFYRAIWDGKNRQGELVSSGVYIYRIHARSSAGDASGSFNQTRKMVFVR